MTTDRYITLSDLAEVGWTAQDIRRACPQATEYTAIDGSPCWLRADLAALLGDPPDND